MSVFVLFGGACSSPSESMCPKAAAPIVVYMDTAAGASSARPAATYVAPDYAHMTCGEASLALAGLVVTKGEKHPEVLAANARISECKDPTPTIDECARVRSEDATAASIYGPRHPTRQVLAAELEVCAKIKR